MAKKGFTLPALGARVWDAVRAGGPPAADPLAVALVRRALDAGLSLLDAGPAEVSPATEGLIALGLHGRSSPVQVNVTLCGEVGSDRPPGGHAADARSLIPRDGVLGPDPARWGDDLSAAITRALHRLQRDQISIGWLDAGALPASRDAQVRRRLDEEPRLGSWGIRFDGAPPDPAMLVELAGLGIPFFGLELHLLNAGLGRSWLEALHQLGATVVDLDPHAGGRLNGAVLRRGPLGAAFHESRPEEWSLVRTRLQPVTRLGYLTQRTGRTLAQAAIRYALDLPAVRCALLTVDEPTVLPEWLNGPGVPALSVEELRRLEEATPGAAGGLG
ncbi:MAG TPA: hypothetical protein VEY07_01120 [Thermoplasmata archaeon]|nr:hypothetical protein [Thermoplasmata archaeon]